MKPRPALQLTELIAYFHGAQRALETLDGPSPAAAPGSAAGPATAAAEPTVDAHEDDRRGRLLDRVRRYRAALEQTAALPPDGLVADAARDPLELLGYWLQEARTAGLPCPSAMALSTVSARGEPSARTVDVKRLEPDALIFTSALWTRKARDIDANEHVAALFHWPQLGRQVHVVGCASRAERSLDEELFAVRKPLHRLQTIVSRQGETIDELAPMRRRLAELQQTHGQGKVPCPEDWGAFRLAPEAIEFWKLSPDRLHDRLLFERRDGAWRRSRLAP